MAGAACTAMGPFATFGTLSGDEQEPQMDRSQRVVPMA